MAVEIIMPQLSDTMDQGTILTWLKKEGESVERGDELAEVGTDKADLPVEAFHQGVLLKIYAKEGETVNVGEVIAVIGEKGESVPDKSSGGSSTGPAASAKASPSEPAPSQPAASAAPAAQTEAPVSERIKASPLAKKIAETKGVSLNGVQGTGEGGRIVKRDVEAISSGAQAVAEVNQATPVQAAPISQVSGINASAPAAPQASAPLPPLQAATLPLSRMRQTIASRMVEATTTIPHFYLTTAIKADKMVETRASLKTHAGYEGITFNHLIIKAAAIALRKFPRINSYFQDNNLIQPGEVNIGIITAIEDGLLIPVLKNADSTPLSDIVSSSKGLVSRARAGKPKGDDLVGATFCISNVGALPIESFTAVISPGNGAILAVGAITDEAVAENKELTLKKIMRLTLSVDHRIIDGVMGAEFLAELKRLIEDPVLLLA